MPRRRARRSSSRAAAAATSPTPTPARRFLSANPHFCQVGAGPLHAARFHRAGREARHRLPREDAGPVVLRRLGAPDRGDAAGRVRRGRGRSPPGAPRHRREADRFRWRPTAAPSRRGAGCWPPAASRSPRWAPPAWRTTWRAASASVTRRGRRWCRFTSRVPDLGGVSLDVVASCGRTLFREAMLFTHRGLSGPAILQISSYWRPGQELAVDLLPDQDPADVAEGAPARPAPGRAAHHPRRVDAAAPGPGAGRRGGDRRAARPDLETPPATGWHVRRPAPKATPRPRSRWAASIPPGCPRGRWRRARCQASSWWARRWMSPAGSAATISSGPGRAAGWRVRRSEL